MREADLDAVQGLPESWFVFMGLWHWAVRQGQQAVITNSSHDAQGHQQHEQAPSALLTQLAQLPYDLVENIASEAFLTPQQAARIHFRSDSSRSSTHLTSDEDYMARETSDPDLNEEERSTSSYWTTDIGYADSPYSDDDK